MANPLLKTDSYKSSHWYMYPPETTRMKAYLEARSGGRYLQTMFFGLQPRLDQLPNFVTYGDVRDAAKKWAAHGLPFNADGWYRLVEKHGGVLPLRIRAVDEGSVVPEGNVLVTVETTDPEFAWLGTWVETLLSRVWYTSTVATRSFACKQVLYKYLKMTSTGDANALVQFMLHDFGGRGVSCEEEARLGGMAHLVNFMGTDTMEAIEAANEYYPTKDDEYKTYGYSIPALEHSTVMLWGRAREADMYRNAIKQSIDRGHKLIACVSDTYDFRNCVEKIWCGELFDYVANSGAKVVIRPDSGDAVEENLWTMDCFSRTRPGAVTVNAKGYRVLPAFFGLIQGDNNNNETDLERVARAFMAAGCSTENIAFGMGAGLLRKVDRDTCRYAYKPCEADVAGETIEVAKKPITDRAKWSKGGNVDLLRGPAGDYITVNDHEVLNGPPVDKTPAEYRDEGYGSALRTVWYNGLKCVPFSFYDVRDRAAAAFARSVK
jgi:nicotinamide phosphoribosyltransferase